MQHFILNRLRSVLSIVNLPSCWLNGIIHVAVDARRKQRQLSFKTSRLHYLAKAKKALH